MLVSKRYIESLEPSSAPARRLEQPERFQCYARPASAFGAVIARRVRRIAPLSFEGNAGAHTVHTSAEVTLAPKTLRAVPLV